MGIALWGTYQSTCGFHVLAASAQGGTASLSFQMQWASHYSSVGAGGGREEGSYPSVALGYPTLQAAQHFSDQTFQINNVFAEKIGKLLISKGA